MALRIEGGAHGPPAAPSGREATRRPENLIEILRRQANVLTLVAAAAGFVAELAPAQANAQVIEQTTHRMEQAPDEQMRLQAQVRKTLEAMSVPTTNITRYLLPT